MNTKGVCLQYLGRFDEGVALIRASVDLAAAHHLSAAELRARYNLAGRLSADDPASAIETLRTGLEVARRTGRRDWLIGLSHFLSTILSMFGVDYDEALAVLDEVPVEDMPPEERAEAIVNRARVLAYRGDATEWARGIGEARALTTDMSSPQRTWDWAVSATLVAIAEGRLADAARESAAIGGNWAGWVGLTHARIALRSRDLEAAQAAIGLPEFAAEVGAVWDLFRLGSGAGIAVLDSRLDEGLAGYREAVRIARQLGLRTTAGDLLLDAVYVLGPDDPDVPAFADEARELFGSVGAKAQLDRLDEALASAARPESARLAGEGATVRGSGR